MPTLDDVARERLQALGRGYAVAVDTFLAGMAAMAVPVRAADGGMLGCLSIAGPAVRMGPDRMAALAPALQAAAVAVGNAAAGSALFRGARA
jgi:IclR family transcriptional regulator, acetate operon repressor